MDIAKFASKTMAGILGRFSFATATTIQQLKNSSNNENTVKCTAFWLLVWKNWCLERGNAKEIKITSWSSFTICSSYSTSKLKTNMIKPRKRRFHSIESDLDTDRKNSLNCLVGLVLCFIDVKIPMYITVLIVRGCFDRIHKLE